MIETRKNWLLIIGINPYVTFASMIMNALITKCYLKMQELNCFSPNYSDQYDIKQFGLAFLLSLSLIVLLGACGAEQRPSVQTENPVPEEVAVRQVAQAAPDEVVIDSLDYDTTQWLELVALDPTILLDIRYATDSNFVGQVMYDCPRCFLRPAAARAVVDAHRELQTEGLGLKMFDCYRPRDVQWKLWEIYPKPGYVADPRKGSIHNRGGAVDLTIVDSLGQELPMGTGFDFFGPKANHTYTDLPKRVLANRQKLKALMAKHGFSAIRSEWWHYNYRGEKYELADEEWNCPTK